MMPASALLFPAAPSSLENKSSSKHQDSGETSDVHGNGMYRSKLYTCLSSHDDWRTRVHQNREISDVHGNGEHVYLLMMRTLPGTVAYGEATNKSWA